MTRYSLTLILILLFTFLTTGCWDRTEVDKLAIVIGLGIDKIPGPNPILLTAQVVNSSAAKMGAGGGKEEPFFVATSQGKTVFDAVQKFAMDSSRRFFFSHSSVIVIGEKLARSGVRPILDSLERAPQVRRVAVMFVTTKTAKEILESKLDLEKLSSLGIKDMIHEFGPTLGVKMVQEKDFVSALLSKSSSTAASKIDLVNEEAEVERELEEANEEIDQDPAKGKKQLRINGTALFNKDKLAGYMNEAESRGLSWLLGDVKGGAVVVSCPEHKQDHFVNRIKRTKPKLTPSYKGEQLTMHIEIKDEGTIAEINCKGLELSKPETIKKLEQLQAKEMEKQIKKAIEKAQKLKSDVLGFGDAFYLKDPKKWKRFEKGWDKHFSKVEVTVHVTCKIERIGMSSEPVHIGE